MHQNVGNSKIFSFLHKMASSKIQTLLIHAREKQLFPEKKLFPTWNIVRHSVHFHREHYTATTILWNTKQ